MSSTVTPHRPPWRLDARGQRWFDIALALALLLPVAAFPATTVGWVATLLAAGQLVPLFWRRHHPRAVFAVVATLSAAQALLVDAPLWSQVGFPVAVYSVARFSDTVAGLVALATGLVGALVASYVWLRGFDQLTPSSFTSYVLFITAIVVTSWALGTLGRTRRAYVDALVERGARIEREAAQQVALAASDERARIAREMHDVVAHGLSVIVVQADGARYAARRDPDVAAATLGAISETGREALREMRRMLGLLRSDDGAVLRPQPGLSDLDTLVSEARTAGARVDADLPDPPPHVPDGVALSTYRVLQEALTNVRKHAGPGVTVRVELTVTDQVRLVVEDDGRGAAAVDDGHGLGLVGMCERVAVHGGSVDTGPRPGGGYRVAVRLPL